MDLEQALEQFDAVEANLRRLEKVWEEMRQLVPDGVAFLGGSPEARRYNELKHAYQSIIGGIPPIGDCCIAAIPWDIDEIAQNRLDSWDIGEIGAQRSVEDGIDLPGREIDEYRIKFRRARGRLINDKLQGIVSNINSLLAGVNSVKDRQGEPHEDERWPQLVEAFEQLERLAGSQIPRAGRWGDMSRHLRFGQAVDLHDITEMDWPSVRSDVQANLFSELEPVPVGTANLMDLVHEKPSGPVTTKLQWSQISDEDFERLLFNLISDADEYVNPQWLTRTNAPDRGRDLSVDRVVSDALSGTRQQRVIIQAKHWGKKSVRPPDVTDALAVISLWEPPIIYSLIFATTGRFTTDAVAFIEKHNAEGKRPQIEMWPESHLELLLARRPHLISGFNLH